LTCATSHWMLHLTLSRFRHRPRARLYPLERFDPLRLENEDENFFPKVRNLLVRRGMKRIFRRFQNDALKRENEKRALLVSPGTGKALLVFLAAVWKEGCPTADRMSYTSTCGKQQMSQCPSFTCFRMETTRLDSTSSGSQSRR
jgi:hypothetical protein